MKKTSKILGFIAISIAMFMGMLDSTIINIALPDITNYFKSTLNDTSWISTIYVLTLSVFMITASKIADQFGRKKVMIAGLILFGGSSALCGMSDSLLFLIAMRAVQGIGGAIITPLVVPIALDAFGKEKTTVIASAIGAVTALAAAGGPPIGALFIEYVNWQSIFYINVPFAFISLIFTIFFIRESYDDTDFQDGINILSDSLSQLKDGASKLYAGAKDLQGGIEAAQSGGNSLKSGSDELINANSKIKDGAAELVNGIALTGQKDEIVSIMDKLSSNKDEKIADAFDKTFFVAAIILLLTSVLGLFTDKSNKASGNTDYKEEQGSMHTLIL